MMMMRDIKTLLITKKEREIYINYSILYVWKIVEGLVSNLFDPITCSLSDRMGRTCIVYHAGVGRLGTFKYNSFRWRSIRMFNRLP